MTTFRVFRNPKTLKTLSVNETSHQMLVWAAGDFVDNTHMHQTMQEVQGLDRQSHATLQPECVSKRHSLQAD